MVLELGGTISSYADNNIAEFYTQKGCSLNHLIEDLPFPKHIEIISEVFCNKISHEFTPSDLIHLGNKIQLMPLAYKAKICSSKSVKRV